MSSDAPITLTHCRMSKRERTARGGRRSRATSFAEVWTAWVECLICGARFLHVELAPEGDEPDGWCPDCPECGSPLTMVTRTAEL